MCGIAGIFDPAGGSKEERGAILRQMTRSLVHRGPDDEGYYVDDLVGLGHRRLSIIDLQTGRQPIGNEDGGVWIIFNGEIYNHRELRDLLSAKGHRFATRTDTETIVHAYEEWGADCVERLHGMFAFALWDRRQRRLFLARDRIGKKPLYYARIGGTLVFGSEIKSLLPFPGLDRSLDLEALSDYFSLLYIPGEKTIFRQVRKLPPGHSLIADERGVHLHRYWDLHFAPAAEPAGAAERLLELLRDAVRTRLGSDVPLGAFLSGGIDSSAVVGLMAEASAAPVVTASIGFPAAEFDELPHARLVARHFHTDHDELVVTPDAVAILEQLSWHYDEPFGDSSAVPTYYVAQLARRRVTVALSGDGGDESFAGYRRYAFDGRENTVRGMLPASLRQPLFSALGALYPKADYLPRVLRGKTFLGNLARSPCEAYVHSVSNIAEDDKQRLLSGDVRSALGDYRTAERFHDLYRAADGPDPLSRIQYIDFKTYLPDDLLAKVDRASMASSLEVRCPLLDHRLVEYAAALPSQLKLRGKHSKLILKSALRGLLPEEILRRPKMGFSMPVAAWLRAELRPMLHEHVLAASAAHDLFDPAAVRTLWRQHQSGMRDRSNELWGLLAFNLWHRRFGSSPPAQPPAPFDFDERSARPAYS
jgi:asparagine synthase (glutamine-hydrolysing)